MSSLLNLLSKSNAKKLKLILVSKALDQFLLTVFIVFYILNLYRFSGVLQNSNLN